jgi:voltage-dependent calcium channel N type alpha-1B
MLLNNEPPMGFGNKCPKILAYRRLIRMNMPVDNEGNVHFTTTLFALIRESLKIKTLNIQDVDDSEMDRADDDLREVIRKLWPFQDIKQIQLALPPQSGMLTQF